MEIIKAIQKGKLAAATSPWPSQAGEPYRPSSGTEGMAFDDHWCERCTRDRPYRDDPDNLDPGFHGCQIIADTFAYDVDDPKYPKEWVYGADGVPKCTAFTTDPSKPVRCDKTADLFGAQ
jgi:hypothetical protein